MYGVRIVGTGTKDSCQAIMSSELLSSWTSCNGIYHPYIHSGAHSIQFTSSVRTYIIHTYIYVHTSSYLYTAYPYMGVSISSSTKKQIPFLLPDRSILLHGETLVTVEALLLVLGNAALTSHCWSMLLSRPAINMRD
jgi:hypothetical protein